MGTKNKYLIALGLLLISMLLIPLVAIGENAVVVNINPSSNTVNVGEEFDVTVDVNDVTNLGGVDFELTFDPSILEVVEVVDGDVFAGKSPIPLKKDVDNVNGSIQYSVMVMSENNAFSGSEDIVKITFKAKDQGTSAIAFKEDSDMGPGGIVLGMPGGGDIPYTSAGGSVTVQIPDTAGPEITPISPAEGQKTGNSNVQINVEIEDQSGINANTVSLLIDDQTISGFTFNPHTNILSYTVPSLAVGTHTIKVAASDNGGRASNKSWTFEVVSTPTPQADKEAGTYYSNTINVKLDNVSGFNVYYTLDGSQPDNTKTAYNAEEGITLAGSGGVTLKAVAYNGIIPGGIATFQYEFASFGTIVAIPAEPTQGYSEPQNIALSIDGSSTDTRILYKLDSANQWAEYNTPIYVDKDTKIYAKIESTLEAPLSSAEQEFNYFFNTEYKTIKTGMDTLVKFATLNDTQLQYLIDLANQIVTNEVLDVDKLLVKDVTSEELLAVIDAMETVLFNGTTSAADFRDAVNEPDYLALVQYVKNIKASIPDEIKNALVKHGITEEDLVLSSLAVMEAGIDFFVLDDQDRQIVNDILAGRGIDEADRAWLAYYGVNYDNLLAFLKKLSPSEQADLRAIVEALSETYVAAPVFDLLTDTQYNTTQNVTIKYNDGTVKYLLVTGEALTLTGDDLVEHIWSNGTKYSAPVVLAQDQNKKTDYFLYAVREKGGQYSSVVYAHYTIMPEKATITGLSVSVQSSDGKVKEPYQGVLYLVAGDKLTIEVTLSEDLPSGLQAVIGGATAWKTVEAEDFTKESGKYRWTYTVAQGDTLTSGKVTASIGGQSMQFDKLLTIDTTAPSIVSVFSPQNNKTIKEGVILNITVLCDATAETATLTLSNMVVIPMTKVAPDLGMFTAMYVTKANDDISNDGIDLKGSVTIADRAGNKTTQENVLNFMIDSKAPVINSVEHQVTGNTLTVTVITNADAKVVTVDIAGYKTNVATAAAGSNTYKATITIPDGTELTNATVTAKAKDAVGNVATKEATNKLNLDTKAPTISYSVKQPKPNGWYVVDPELKVTSNENGTIKYTVNGGTATGISCQADLLTLIPVNEGESTIVFWAEDNSGNPSTKYTMKFKVDTKKPVIALNEIKEQDINTNNGTANLTGTINENGLKVEVYKIHANNAKELVSNVNAVDGAYSLTVSLKNGKNTFQAVTKDAAGNEGISNIVECVFDNKGPVFTVTVTKNEGQESDVNISASESIKPETLYYKLRVDKKDKADFVLTPGNGNTWSGKFPASGTIDFVIEANDMAGNKGTSIYTATNVVASVGAEIGGNEVALLIPAGALGENLTVEAGEDDSNDAVLGNMGIDVTKTVDFRPDGTKFANPVRITLPYDKNITDTAKIKIMYYNKDKGEWEDYTNKIKEIKGAPDYTVTFETDHFSQYGAASDTTPPVLTVTAPENDIYTSQNQIIVTGTSEAGAAISVKVNNKEEQGNTTVAANGSYSVTVPLEANIQNTLTITATDKAKNATTETRVLIQDNVAPVVTVTTPADGFRTANGIVTVTGTVADENLKELKINGQNVAVVEGNFTTAISLTEGSNAITFEATDKVGLKGSKAITVVKDTTATITVTSPADGTVTGKEEVIITGTTGEDKDADVTIKEITRGAEFPGKAVDGKFSIKITLAEGINHLQAIAIDKLGNASSSFDWSVERIVGLPGITLDEIATPTRNNTITISGTITSNLEIIAATWTSGNNGGKIEIGEQGKFTITNIPLEEGENTISLTVVNESGTAQENIQVTKDSTGPEINIDSHDNGDSVDSTSVTITGTMNEPGTVTAKVGSFIGSATVTGENGGNFSIPLTLAENSVNTITIEATDSLGNKTTKVLSLNCTYKTPGGGTSGGGGGPSNETTVSDSDVTKQLNDGKSEITITAPKGTETVVINAGTYNKIAQAGKDLVIKTDVITFRIPADTFAVSGSTKISISLDELSSNNANKVLDKAGKDYAAIGEVYELTSSQPLKKAIQVTLFYNDDTVINEDNLDVYWFNESEGKWVAMDGKVNKTNNSVTFTTTHFSKYAVLEFTGTATFKDIANHWAKDDIELMVSKDVIKGINANEFAPNAAVTRAQFAAMLVRAIGLETATTNSLGFNDVKGTDWFYAEVAAAFNAGIIKGLDADTFAPNANITREQMAAMITRAMEYAGKGLDVTEEEAKQQLSIFNDASQIASWANVDVAKALQAGIIKGRTAHTFVAKANATRAESAVMIKRMYEQIN